MSPDAKLRYWKDEWARIFVQEVGLSKDDAEKVVHIAELNGMFDPYKTLFAIQTLVN